MTFDGTLYAANTAHHRAHDAEVLAGVPLAAGTRVLDLGCGSGDFTAALVPAVAPGGRVVGVDVSPSQVEHARAHHPGAEFLVGRAQDVGGLFPPASFDVVVSVATLHWVPDADQPSVITGLAAVLRRGGVLRIDMGGAGQIEVARQVLDEVSASFGGPASPWYFPTAAGLPGAAGGRRVSASAGPAWCGSAGPSPTLWRSRAGCAARSSRRTCRASLPTGATASPPPRSRPASNASAGRTGATTRTTSASTSSRSADPRFHGRRVD